MSETKEIYQGLEALGKISEEVINCSKSPASRCQTLRDNLKKMDAFHQQRMTEAGYRETFLAGQSVIHQIREKMKKGHPLFQQDIVGLLKLDQRIPLSLYFRHESVKKGDQLVQGYSGISELANLAKRYFSSTGDTSKRFATQKVNGEKACVQKVGAISKLLKAIKRFFGESSRILKNKIKNAWAPPEPNFLTVDREQYERLKALRSTLDPDKMATGHRLESKAQVSWGASQKALMGILEQSIGKDTFAKVLADYRLKPGNPNPRANLKSFRAFMKHLQELPPNPAKGWPGGKQLKVMLRGEFPDNVVKQSNITRYFDTSLVREPAEASRNIAQSKVTVRERSYAEIPDYDKILPEKPYRGWRFDPKTGRDTRVTISRNKNGKLVVTQKSLRPDGTLAVVHKRYSDPKKLAEEFGSFRPLGHGQFHKLEIKIRSGQNIKIPGLKGYSGNNTVQKYDLTLTAKDADDFANGRISPDELKARLHAHNQRRLSGAENADWSPKNQNQRIETIIEYLKHQQAVKKAHHQDQVKKGLAEPKTDAQLRRAVGATGYDRDAISVKATPNLTPVADQNSPVKLEFTFDADSRYLSLGGGDRVVSPEELMNPSYIYQRARTGELHAEAKIPVNAITEGAIGVVKRGVEQTATGEASRIAEQWHNAIRPIPNDQHGKFWRLYRESRRFPSGGLIEAPAGP